MTLDAYTTVQTTTQQLSYCIEILIGIIDLKTVFFQLTYLQYYSLRNTMLLNY